MAQGRPNCDLPLIEKGICTWAACHFRCRPQFVWHPSELYGSRVRCLLIAPLEANTNELIDVLAAHNAETKRSFDISDSDPRKPFDFEDIALDLLRGSGALVEQRSFAGRDTGVDAAAFLEGTEEQLGTLVVQCKWSDARPQLDTWIRSRDRLSDYVLRSPRAFGLFVYGTGDASEVRIPLPFTWPRSGVSWPPGPVWLSAPCRTYGLGGCCRRAWSTA